MESRWQKSATLKYSFSCLLSGLFLAHSVHRFQKYSRSGSSRLFWTSSDVQNFQVLIPLLSTYFGEIRHCAVAMVVRMPKYKSCLRKDIRRTRWAQWLLRLESSVEVVPSWRYSSDCTLLTDVRQRNRGSVYMPQDRRRTFEIDRRVESSDILRVPQPSPSSIPLFTDQQAN